MIEEFDGSAPSNWKGFRELTEKWFMIYEKGWFNMKIGILNEVSLWSL